MSPEIATFAFAVGVLGLFALDRDRNAQTSKALWLPVIWVSLAGSRMVSQWLDPRSLALSRDRLVEGNPLDRAILAGLMAVGVIVLLRRGREVRKLLRANAPIVVFFCYCAVSVLWSDFPEVAFKRWTKAVGDLLMALIVLTEPDRTAALKRFLARIGFLLMPASILLIKYYPNLGRFYSHWDGKVRNAGVTLDKNMLGAICLVSGLGCVWRLIEAFRGGKGTRKAAPLIAQGVLLAMVLWLFLAAHSMTSLACFLLASGVTIATSFPVLAQKRAAVHFLVVSELCIAFAVLFLGVGMELLEAIGKDPTLTGRTGLWQTLLSTNTDPILGAGFESYWLGTRLARICGMYWWCPNEAHNGYLEVLLNLGWMGIALLALVITTGYRNLVSAFYKDLDTGRLGLGYFLAALAYGFTEAAFRVMDPVWFFFLLATLGSSPHPIPIGETTVSTTFPPVGDALSSSNRG